jgi:hypothetical protein
MEKKLTPEELENFRNSRSRFLDLRESLADIVINQERLESQRKSTLINIEQSYDEFQKIQNEIVEKYGPGNINLQTGEIK